MRNTRRQFLAAIGAAGVAAGLGGAGMAVAATGSGREVLTASDGHLVLPGDFLFDGLPEAALSEILERYGVPHDRVEPPCNVTVLRDGARTVLFDAGSGPAFMPSAGTLVDALYDIGIAPDDVTDIVFTHGHPDHLWGVLDDFDELTFQQAQYHFGQSEWDYWSDPKTVDTIGQARAAFAVGAGRRLDAIAERTRFFRPGQEVMPGVMAHATHGHTPGHMSFEIAVGGDPVLVVGDAIGNGHVAFERPDWPSGADQDAQMGARTRQRLLDQAATDRMRVIGFHLPAGGIGRVEHKDGAYRFVREGME